MLVSETLLTVLGRLSCFVLPGFMCPRLATTDADAHLFACCIVASTLQAVMVGAVTNDGLRQALQEKQQGFGHRMVASTFGHC